MDKKTKHLTASQAKKLYSNYWSDYFKFSFVRDPYSRMLSLGSQANLRRVYFGDVPPPRGIVSTQHIDAYRKVFGSPVLIEHDHRFYKRIDIEGDHHQENCVYGNILDEPIDYVGRYENLKEDFGKICRAIGVKDKTLTSSGTRLSGLILSSEAKRLIDEIFEQDFRVYNYLMDE